MAENFTRKNDPDTDLRGNSANWANWMARLLPNTCKFCEDQHGKIVPIAILEGQDEVEAHPHCQCVYVAMRTKQSGTVTDMGENGAEVYLKQYGKLPDYYITKDEAKNAGWKNKKGNLNKVLPGKFIGGDSYRNDDFKLPTAPRRTWHEADINYMGGHRNSERILYSNDGLYFVTYDHYHTFYEITP